MNKMSIKERLVHTILFEATLLTLMTILIILFSEHKAGFALGIGIFLSILAMIWNFVYNYLVDKVATGERHKRGFIFRLFHSAGFELGFLFVTLPVIAWALKLSIWQAFILDISVMVMVLIYSLIFNWIYDVVRNKCFA